MATNLPTIILHGQTFFVVPRSWSPDLKGPAVYILAHYEPFLRRPAWLYVGETGELADYIGPSHHKWAKALAQGMTFILVHSEPNEQRRLTLETILRQQLRPPLNEQTAPTRNALTERLGQHYGS